MGLLKVSAFCSMCSVGTVSRDSLTSPPQPGSCTRPAMAGYPPPRLRLPNKERLRTGGRDDSLGRSLSVNLRVMEYYLNSHRYRSALTHLVELFGSLVLRTFNLFCLVIFFKKLTLSNRHFFKQSPRVFFFPDGDQFHP